MKLGILQTSTVTGSICEICEWECCVQNSHCYTQNTCCGKYDGRSTDHIFLYILIMIQLFDCPPHSSMYPLYILYPKSNEIYSTHCTFVVTIAHNMCKLLYKMTCNFIFVKYIALCPTIGAMTINWHCINMYNNIKLLSGSLLCQSAY